MLPASLNNAFQLYKRDTNAIATWLVNTAKNHGHPIHTDDNQPKERLKGKARKEAKTATASDSQASSSEKKEPYLLHLRDFVPLATFIASVKPQIQVPLFMAVTIKRVIEVRKTVTRIMGTRDGTKAEEESTASHIHFVGVLEQVRDILKQQMPIDELDISSLKISPAGDDSGSSGQDDNEGSSRNPFDILNLYDTTQQVSESAEDSSPSELVIEYEPDPQDQWQEACLAFMSLMDAMVEQRQMVQKVWSNYRAGNIYLGPAAVAANEAIDFCRRMEEDVSSIITREFSMEYFMWIVFSLFCKQDGQELLLPGRRKRANFDTYGLASLTMWHVSHVLRQCMLNDRKGSSIIYTGSAGWFDETLDEVSSTNKQRFRQDERALTEAFWDIKILDVVSNKKNIEDEFTRGMRLLCETDEVTLWQCFAAQVYLDALDELHGHLDLAWSEMAGTGAAIKSSLTSVLEDPGDVRLVEHWRDTEETLKQLKSAASEWENDPVARYKSERGVEAEPKQFLRRHPLFCGMWAHEMRTRFHEAGVNFASSFGYVHQTYQLYNALKQEGLLPLPILWMDLMSLSQTQQPDTFFVGKAPSTAQGYLENFRLKSGLSATDQTQGKNKGKSKRTPPPNAERGQLKDVGAISMVFKKRFRKTYRREMTPKYLQKIIESNGFRFVNGEDGKWGLEKAKAGTDLERNPGPDIPASQLTVCVAMAMRSEAHHLGLNLFSLHMDCYKVLEEIRKTIDEKTVLRLAPESTKQKQLPSVVAMVFRDAAGDEPEGLLQRAASVVSEHWLEISSMGSTMGIRDLGFSPCRCPQNTGRATAATRNCLDLQCGGHETSVTRLAGFMAKIFRETEQKN